MDLQHLRAAFGLSVKLEHKPGVRLRLHGEVELRCDGSLLPDGDPPAVEDAGPWLRPGEVQRHHHPPQKPSCANSTGGTPPAGVDGDTEAVAGAEEDGAAGEPGQVGAAQVEDRGRVKGGLGGIGMGGIGGGNGGDLVGEVLQLYVAEAGGWDGVYAGVGWLRRHGNLESEAADGQADERARIHVYSNLPPRSTSTLS